MKKLIIIGGTGSLGNSLVKKLLKIYKIYILSRDENKHWIMKKLYPTIDFSICDIRDKARVKELFLKINPDKIILASALKHIDICENNISECIKTNILGIQNIIECITECKRQNNLSMLDCLIFISTDKAVSPVNVYGMCKSICERMIAEKYLEDDLGVKFITVRYGNVISSRGSIFPLFKELGENKECKTFPVTDKSMTRFFLTLDESVDLILYAMDHGKNGYTYVPQAKSFKIGDIVDIFSEIYNKDITVIGKRAGEKLHECLINETEMCRTTTENNYFAIKPCYINSEETVLNTEYSSDNFLLNKEVLREVINKITKESS